MIEFNLRVDPAEGINNIWIVVRSRSFISAFSLSPRVPTYSPYLLGTIPRSPHILPTLYVYVCEYTKGFPLPTLLFAGLSRRVLDKRQIIRGDPIYINSIASYYMEWNDMI